MARRANRKLTMLPIAAWIALLAAWSSPQRAAAEVLLLRNGNTLVGQATRHQGRWQVQLQAGGSVSVAGSTVEFVGADLAAVHQHKRDRLPPRDGRSLADLIDWSLKHQLLDQARRDLDQLRRLDPANQRRDGLERRWQDLSASGDRAQSKSTVRIAAPISESRNRSDRVAVRSELALAGLTAPQLVEFSRRAYPVLRQRCAGARCHSAVAGNFDRPLLVYDRAVVTGATSKSLQRVTAWVDVNEPAASALLRYSQTAHGTWTKPPLGTDDRAAYEQLASWVKDFAQSKSGRAATGTDGRDVASDRNAAALDPLDPELFHRRYATDDRDEQSEQVFPETEN